MAQPNQSSQSSSYKQGHSNYTVATHQTRTAQSDASFLLPHIQKTDHILDVGCGPGTITTGLSKYASEGKTVGVDIAPSVLQKAKTLAAEARIPTQGPGAVVFEEGNVLTGLAYPDNTFDIVFAAHVLGHFQAPDVPIKALTEMRRVLKPGGILATRDAAAQHFYPRRLNMDRLWVGNQLLVAFGKGALDADPTGARMPELYRGAGFDTDGGKIVVGAGTMVYAGAETRKWLAWRASGQLKQGDAVHQSWLDAGISEDEIQETLRAVEKWAATDDAWFAALQCEMLAWK